MSPSFPLKLTHSSLIVIYLHGFLSSPASIKAQQTLVYCRERDIEIHIPELPFEPADAKQQMVTLLKQLMAKARKEDKALLLIGSSLGGYYATDLAEQFGVPAALINPAVKPHNLFKDYLGEHQHFYNGQTYVLTEQHVEQIKALFRPTLNTPNQLLLLLQTGDETLDYRQAAEYYQESRQICEGGGDHSYQNYVLRLDNIMTWRLDQMSPTPD